MAAARALSQDFPESAVQKWLNKAVEVQAIIDELDTPPLP